MISDIFIDIIRHMSTLYNSTLYKIRMNEEKLDPGISMNYITIQWERIDCYWLIKNFLNESI